MRTTDIPEKTGVSQDAFFAGGYSASGLLILFVTGLVVSITPIAMSWWKVSGIMVSGGSDSLVISAACHVNRLRTQRSKSKKVSKILAPSSVRCALQTFI